VCKRCTAAVSRAQELTVAVWLGSAAAFIGAAGHWMEGVRVKRVTEQNDLSAHSLLPLGGAKQNRNMALLFLATALYLLTASAVALVLARHKRARVGGCRAASAGLTPTQQQAAAQLDGQLRVFADAVAMQDGHAGAHACMYACMGLHRGGAPSAV